MILEGNVSTAIIQATGCDPNELRDLDLPPAPFELRDVVMHAASAFWDSPPKLWSVENFKHKYYDDKWREHGLTSFHPKRLPHLWEASSLSNWILLGSKVDAAIAVVKGQIDPPKTMKRFKVDFLVELPRISTDIKPLESRSPASGISPRKGGEAAPSGPENGGNSVDNRTPNPEDTQPIELGAIGYAAWALDCLRKKQYQDAEAHLITALRRSGYYRNG